MKKPNISVITTTWNRGKYLARVHSGLLRQSFNDFEWIVADDGSDDGTVKIVNDLACKSQFPVLLIESNVHIGKARLDNEAISTARGEFIIWCDSDDYLLPNALEELFKCWKSIDSKDKDKYIGIVGLCVSEDKFLNQNIHKHKSFDAKLNDLEFIHDMKEDSSLFLRSDILKKHKFPEVDLVVPESSVWSELGEFKIRVLPEAVLKKEYNVENAISFTPLMKYNRGRAYSLAITFKNKNPIAMSWLKRLRLIINYHRYCVHGDLNISESIKLWGDNSSRLIFIICLVPAYLISIKDALQKKVIKTHKEFLESKKTLRIKKTYFKI